jgi:hypothetical protein
MFMINENRDNANEAIIKSYLRCVMSVYGASVPTCDFYENGKQCAYANKFEVARTYR